MKTSAWRVCCLLASSMASIAAGASGASSSKLSMPLAGAWRFSLDPGGYGLAKHWYNTRLPGTIHLPGTTDEAGYGPRTVGSDHGVLTRVHKYYGPAWYQRDVVVPAAWSGKPVDLYLERVIWESTAWLDGRRVSALDSLNTPHVHRLGVLKPGRHTLTLRISNLPIHPISNMGHSYTEQTQTIWNGAVGRLELRAHETVELGMVRAFPDAARHRVSIEASLTNNSRRPRNGALRYALRERRSGRAFASGTMPFTVSPGGRIVRASLALPRAPRLWDEFSPTLYSLEVAVKGESEVSTVPVGFRTVARNGRHIAVNGRTIFLRGNLDCVHFPLTGYPATTVGPWKRIFRIYRAHGLNHVRFHSWTPPEAAFQAADEMGIYIECEVIWTQRHIGKDTPGPMENMSREFPPKLLKHPGTVDAYARAEISRVVDAYGNHPSFLMFCIGNELGSIDIPIAGQWIHEEKQHDPRHLYAVTTARQISPFCDFSVTHAVPDIGWVRDRVDPYNDWDYEALYSRAPVPIIAHEVGQWPTYPAWSEIAKYTGVVRARNLEGFRAQARRNGVAEQDKEFRAASGALAMRLYKDEIESHLRTPSCSGFDLLSMQDFSGQGEALVGWLDSFYDSKGIVTPERFNRWCGPTVPLARLPRYVYTEGETVTGRLVVSHYGAGALRHVVPEWRLLSSGGRVLASGRLTAKDVPTGGVTDLGSFAVPLTGCVAPCRVRLEVSLKGANAANDWDLWVFPKGVPAEPSDVLVCQTLGEAVPALKAGRKVLLIANRLGDRRNAQLANWKPAYWSASYFPWSETLGALVHAGHPALAAFPTDRSLDWQWQDLCRGGRGFVLNSMPAAYKPIVQPISDFHFNDKLGSLFELRTREGGRLVVCGYDIASNLASRPAARQLRSSVLRYMATPLFAPKQMIGDDALTALFPVVRDATISAPPGVEGSVLYVNAGAKHTDNGDVPWSADVDEVKAQESGFSYSVQCDAVWRDEGGAAWHGSPGMKVIVQTPKANLYDLYVHFGDWNNLGRTGTIVFEGRKFNLGEHKGDGQWVKLGVSREDCRDDRLVLQTSCDNGPNLMITALALVPRG
ncbi:MAG TPA: glycoside hydrolase family 2 [Armatimonadota bacterium]